MTPKPDGGPAYPNSIRTETQNTAVSGMTLRDYFAGQAIIAVIMAARTTELTNKSIRSAYEIADAMIAERGK